MRQVTSLLDRGQVYLRKWCSNDPAVLQQFPDSEKETFLKFDDGSDITKTLGLAWDLVSDNLLYSFSPLQCPSKPSKRTVLSTIALFYDTLGLICPAINKSWSGMRVFPHRSTHPGTSCQGTYRRVQLKFMHSVTLLLMPSEDVFMLFQWRKEGVQLSFSVPSLEWPR
ncbi:hypothetical protein ACLKA7_000066 [Drosophila subpalustris]